MPSETGHLYRFGPFVVDVADRSLKRQGTSVTLTPKLFDLLVCLVSNAGRLVEKETLLQRVWPDVAVEEGNLSKGIFSLRQLLGQRPEGEYIETVPKRGYRFAAIVTTGAQEKEPVGAAEQDAEPLENSIAVLPFTDMSASRDQEFFCEGMSEEIIGALGRLTNLRVASYTSSRRFKGRDVDPRVIRTGSPGVMVTRRECAEVERHRADFCSARPHKGWF